MAGEEFSRLEYRRTTGWPERIRREGPFLEARLGEAPAGGWVVDLGCGSGEHARHLAARGHPAIGCDRSAAAVAMAREARDEDPAGGCCLWVQADLGALPLRGGIARLALCLGNTLALLGSDEGVLEALAAARRVLRPGGRVVVQVLNYYRLRRQGERWLPVNLRPQGEGELVYLRLMDFDEPEHVSFHVITLERRAGSDEVVVRRSVRRRLRSLEYRDLERLLAAAGFGEVRLFGGYGGESFDPDSSSDVVAVAW